MTPSSARQGDRQLEITLLQERSTGTFARVYLAEARGSGGLSRVVAVKVIKEQWSDSTEILTRSRDEARLLSRLQHRNILRVEALAQVDGQPAIVMEFVDGLDLRQLIEGLAERGRKVPRRAVYTILAGSGSALAAAWEEVPLTMSGPLRVVHRDIKPGNIMVSRQGEVKVLDFGTARFDFTERQARTGAMRFGSLKYMSPERRKGDRGDHPSDVYALGLVAIELLRGELLPVLPHEPDEHDAILADAIRRLGDLGLPDARWDDALRQTLHGMVAADPARRLHASQVVPLFRSFADNATGVSLESFGSETVAELARQTFGTAPIGELSGSRVFVAMTTSSDLPPPSTGAPGLRHHATMVPDDVPDDLPDDPGLVGSASQPAAASPQDPGFSDVDRPTQVSISRSLDIGPDRETQVTGSDEVEAPTILAGRADTGRADSGRQEAVEPLPVTAAPADAPFPEPESVTRRAEPQTGPHAPQRDIDRTLEPVQFMDARRSTPLPDDEDDDDGGGRSNLVVGLIAAAVVFIIGGVLIAFAVTALGLWWYFGQGDPSVSGPAPVTADAAPDDADPDAAPDDADGAPVTGAATWTVSLTSSDDMVQWTAIENPAGDRLFKGSPSGDVDLPAGDYTLLAKVRARSTVKAPLSISADLQLDCSSAEKGAVRCDRSDGQPLLLEP